MVVLTEDLHEVVEVHLVLGVEERGDVLHDSAEQGHDVVLILDDSPIYVEPAHLAFLVEDKVALEEGAVVLAKVLEKETEVSEDEYLLPTERNTAHTVCAS